MISAKGSPELINTIAVIKQSTEALSRETPELINTIAGIEQSTLYREKSFRNITYGNFFSLSMFEGYHGFVRDGWENTPPPPQPIGPLPKEGIPAVYIFTP